MGESLVEELGLDGLSVSCTFAHLTRLELMDYLVQEGPMTYEQMHEVCDCNKHTLNMHIRYLLQSKIIEEKDDAYSVTREGKAVFEDLIERAKKRLE